MAQTSMQELIEILKSRKLPVDHDAIAAAFADAESAAAIEAWMKEYLGPETLLTAEEAALYKALSESGEFETLAASQDLMTVECLPSEDIQDAITELERSTGVIEKQNETLRLQQVAMRNLVKDKNRNEELRSQVVDGQMRNWNLETSRVTAEVRGITSTLQMRVSDLEQQSRASDIALKQHVDEILKSDDRLLASLQKLASEIDPGQSEDDEIISRIRELCARLIKHTVEGVRTKLDRIYLEALNSVEPIADSGHHDEHEIAKIKEELESLYSEILLVAQMSAEQQFLMPALQEFEARTAQNDVRSVKAMRYIHDCLLYLHSRLHSYSGRVEEHRSYQMALRAISDAAKQEIGQARPSSPAKPAGGKSSISKTQKASLSQSPVKGRNALRRSSLQGEEDVEPEQQLLRALGLSLPSEISSEKARLEALESTMDDRVTKLEGHAANLQSSMESSILSHLHDARIILQTLQDALLSETMYHEPKLLDSDIEEAVGMFEAEIQDLEQKLESLDLRKLQASNVHRKRIVERWSR